MFICENCNENMIYCSGPIKGSYLRHKSGSICKSNGGESTIHKLCKKIIKESLEKGNTLIINKICECDSIILNVKLEEGDKVIEEYRDDNNIYDLVIFNNEIKLVIEIYHTHKQIRKRDFVELKTSEILTNTNNFTYNYQCNNCNSIKLRKRMNHYEKILGIISEETISETMKEIWQIAIDGKCNAMIKQYNTKNYKKDLCWDKNSFWNEFIRHQRCIKCLNNTKTSYFKPFCISCFKNVNNEKEYCRMTLLQFQPRLRYIFNKLNIPSGIERNYDLCKICNKNYCNNLFYWNISDLNKYKHICYYCLYNSIKDDDNFKILYDEIKEIRSKYILKFK